MRRVLFFVPLLFAIGCAHKPEAKKETSTAARDSGSAPMSANTPAETTCSRDLDCKEKQLCIRNRCVDISAGLAECNQVRVHFEFNSSDIAADGKTDLERSARCLRADNALHVT